MYTPTITTLFRIQWNQLMGLFFVIKTRLPLAALDGQPPALVMSLPTKLRTQVAPFIFIPHELAISETKTLYCRCLYFSNLNECKQNNIHIIHMILQVATLGIVVCSRKDWDGSKSESSAQFRVGR